MKATKTYGAMRMHQAVQMNEDVIDVFNELGSGPDAGRAQGYALGYLVLMYQTTVMDCLRQQSGPVMGRPVTSSDPDLDDFLNKGMLEMVHDLASEQDQDVLDKKLRTLIECVQSNKSQFTH